MVTGDTTQAKIEELHEMSCAPVMSMLLAAQFEGLSSCWIGSAKPEKVSKTLCLPEDTAYISLIALGYSECVSEIVDIPENGDIKYYLNENGSIIVPKVCFKDIAKFI